MKYAVLISLTLIVSCTYSYSPWANWKIRMQNYGKLTRCNYYLTSENAYKDYIKINTKSVDNDLEFRIYSLAQNKFRFLLTDVDNSDSYEIVVGDRHNGNGSNGGGSGGSGGGSNGGGSGGSNSGPSLVGNIDDKSDAFESNEDYVISYINVNGKRVKSIASPEIIRQDQPNEVYIRLFKEGKLLVTINENTSVEIKAQDPIDLEYVSFKSAVNNHAEEFFYNCDSK